MIEATNLLLQISFSLVNCALQRKDQKIYHPASGDFSKTGATLRSEETTANNRFLPSVNELWPRLHVAWCHGQINNNYSPQFRLLVVEISEAAKRRGKNAKRRGKYPLLATETEVNNCFSIY